MTDLSGNKGFLVKYCKVMISKLDKSEDQERMNKWLETVTDAECDGETGEMYLELILWALHTDRINVFPFKYLPPVDHGDIHDAYQYAQEIVQFEPEENKKEKCGEIKTLVTDDLKEYFAVQAVPGFGSQCFYAFSVKTPISCWTMPSDINTAFKEELKHEPQYWMALFSRPENTINEMSNTVQEEKAVESVDEATAEDKDTQKSDKSICPDLCKVEYILNNLSFGGTKPQDIRSLVDKDDPNCNDREISVKESFDDTIRGPEVEIDTYVMSVDYTKSRSAGLSSSSKKNEKKCKDTKQKSKQRVPCTFSNRNRRSYYCDDNGTNSLNDQLVFSRDKKRTIMLNNGYDMNNGSSPDHSTIALYNSSKFDDKCSAFNIRKEDSSLARNYSTLKNQSFSGNSKKPQITGTTGNSKLRGEKCVKPTTGHKFIKDDERNRNNSLRNCPPSKNSRNQRPTYSDTAECHKRRDIASRSFQGFGYFEDESYEFDCKDLTNQVPSTCAINRRVSTSPVRSNISQSTSARDECSEIKTAKVPSYADSVKSERRLQFSDILVEPSQHKPKVPAETPLKPCLRKSSNESPSLYKSDNYDQLCRPKAFKHKGNF